VLFWVSWRVRGRIWWWTATSVAWRITARTSSSVTLPLAWSFLGWVIVSRAAFTSASWLGSLSGLMIVLLLHLGFFFLRFSSNSDLFLG
jgi:hypothetical protein